MKKILIILIAAVSIAVSASALSLKEAFAALSNVPNMTVKTDYNTPVLGLIANGQIARAQNLDKSQIKDSGNAVYNVLNAVPLSTMINGGNNNLVAAFIYASPEPEDGIYETLMVLMSGRAGDITVIYGGIDEAARNAIQSAPLGMAEFDIDISAKLPDGEIFNLTVN